MSLILCIVTTRPPGSTGTSPDLIFGIMEWVTNCNISFTQTHLNFFQPAKFFACFIVYNKGHLSDVWGLYVFLEPFVLPFAPHFDLKYLPSWIWRELGAPIWTKYTSHFHLGSYKVIFPGHGGLPCVLPYAVHLDIGYLPDIQGYLGLLSEPCTPTQTLKKL